MIGCDFGVGNKLQWYGDYGLITPPSPPRGLSFAEKFAWLLSYFLNIDDVVTESPTVGSSGAESSMIREVVRSSSHQLYTISARAVKNYVKSKGLTKPSDGECAEIIHK